MVSVFSISQKSTAISRLSSGVSTKPTDQLSDFSGFRSTLPWATRFTELEQSSTSWPGSPPFSAAYRHR